MSRQLLNNDSSSSSSDSDEEEEEVLDPRIQVELEKLNSSTDVINKLELDLDEARSQFRKLLQESTQKLNSLSKEIGPSLVERSRCYYDARAVARKAMAEAQTAASRYEKASSALEAAKEMVTLAEEGFKERGDAEFDLAWQEMLNHATNRVNDSEQEKILSAKEHREKSRAYQRSEKRVQELEKTLRKAIRKSRPYFEMKAKYNTKLDDQKRQIQVIEETVQMTKIGYAESLRQLERISEEIHAQRNKVKALGERGQGVGAEASDIEQKEGSDKHSEKKDSQHHHHHHHHKSSEAMQRQRDQLRLYLRQSSLCQNQDLEKPSNVPSVAAESGSGSKWAASSCPRSPSSNVTSTASSPMKSPAYEPLQSNEPENDESEGDLATKMNFLKVASSGTTPEENFSDSESLASMEMLDDDTIDKLMLATDLEGFKISTPDDSETSQCQEETIQSQ